jgi:hypothetical protein
MHGKSKLISLVSGNNLLEDSDTGETFWGNPNEYIGAKPVEITQDIIKNAMKLFRDDNGLLQMPLTEKKGLLGKIAERFQVPVPPGTELMLIPLRH